MTGVTGGGLGNKVLMMILTVLMLMCSIFTHITPTSRRINTDGKKSFVAIKQKSLPCRF